MEVPFRRELAFVITTASLLLEALRIQIREAFFLFNGDFVIMKPMKNWLFVILVLVILAAIGGVFWFWWQGDGVKNEDGGALRQNSSASETLPSSATIEPVSSYQKPTEDAIIKFPIFNYHHIRPMPNVASSTVTDRAFTVSPEVLEAHLKYFKDNGYQVISVYDLLDYFDMGKLLPAKAIAITFDDGRYGQYKWAFPLLKKYGMTATFFVITDWVDKPDFLTWPQIKEMSDNDMTIGSHTLDHPALTKLNDDQLKNELVNSKKILEEKIGRKVDLLAYPGGDYNAHVIDFTKEAGYQAAFSVYKIIEQGPKFRYTIRRFHADDVLESITSKLVGY